MAAVLERFMSSFEQSLDEFDAREASGEVSLDLPLLDFNHLVIANILYFAVLLALHNFMKSRDAYKLTGFMRFYNVSCVIAAGAVVYGGVVHHFKYQTFQFVGNDNMLDLRQESGRHLRFFMWVYYAQKFWEFLDTVVFILRKSYRQVTFLHIYHHCSITFVTRTFIVYGQSGDMIVPSWLNALVHVFMYSHYLCATFKIKTWWRPYLTQMQLIQFVAILVQSIAGYLMGSTVSYPDWVKLMLLGYMITMLYLFGSFYVKSYSKPKDGAKKKE